MYRFYVLVSVKLPTVSADTTQTWDDFLHHLYYIEILLCIKLHIPINL